MTDPSVPEPTGQPIQRSPVVGAYEVHVEGRLGRALLGYLRWSNRTQPEQSIVRVEASFDDLQQFLTSCSSCGLSVERVTRIDPGSDRGRRPSC